MVKHFKDIQRIWGVLDDLKELYGEADEARRGKTKVVRHRGSNHHMGSNMTRVQSSSRQGSHR